MQGSDSGGGASASVWPKRVVLRADPGDSDSDGLRLENGSTVAGDGDLRLGVGYVMSLRSSRPAAVCDKGVYATLAEVPTDTDSCPGDSTGAWMGFVYLSATTNHTTEEATSAGLGFLVRAAEADVLYRGWVVGDAYGASGASVTFDYEPVE